MIYLRLYRLCIHPIHRFSFPSIVYIYIIIIVFIPIDEIILARKRHLGDILSGFNPRYNNFPFDF